MTRSRLTLLAAIVAAQLVLLVGITALQGARVAAGTRVELAVVPVDPLDLARGAFVELEYEIAELDPPRDVADDREVWVVVQPPRTGATAWRGERVVADLDAVRAGDVYVRARVVDDHLEFPDIETYYASAEEAQRLERELADGGIASVSLDQDGRPTLVEVSG